jgi:hypothetical protein
VEQVADALSLDLARIQTLGEDLYVSGRIHR